jgi:hypothetical protein
MLRLRDALRGMANASSDEQRISAVITPRLGPSSAASSAVPQCDEERIDVAGGSPSGRRRTASRTAKGRVRRGPSLRVEGYRLIATLRALVSAARPNVSYASSI